MRRKIWLCFSLLTVMTLAISAVGAGAAPAAEESSPYLRAFPEQQFVDGGNWPAGDLVSLAVPGGTFEVTSDEDGRVEFYLEESAFGRGDELTMSDGTLTVTYTVRQLFITDVDLDELTVAGTIDGQDPVHVFIDEDQVFVDPENGAWLADISGFDPSLFHPGTQIAAEAWGGEGNSSTIVNWSIPEVHNPFIWADPRNESISGWDWPEGESVTFELFNPGGEQIYSDTRTAEGELGYDLRSEGIDVEAGDRVVFHTEGITKELIVSNLAITGFDASGKTISGEYDPGLDFWINLGGQEPTATSFDGEQWSATFEEFGRDMCGEAAQPDEDGDMTGIGFCTPNPHFSAYPVWDWLELYDWPIGVEVEVTIFKPANEGSPDFDESYTIETSDWDPSSGYLHVEFEETYNLEIGDTVRIQGGGYDIQYTLKPLTVNPANAGTDTVSGTADPFETVYAWSHENGEQVTADADGSGAWEAYLGDVVDITPGSDGRTEVRDEMGNTTTVDWHAPNPHITVFPEFSSVELWEWPIGAMVHLSINDPDTGEDPDFEGDYEVLPADWNPNESFLSIDVSEFYDIDTGDLVEIEGGGFDVSYEVRAIWVDGINADNDTVTGTADPGAEVYVWPHEYGGLWDSMSVKTDDSGRWVADLHELDYDIVPGSSGRAEIVDEVGNTTGIDWFKVLEIQIDIRPFEDQNYQACRLPNSQIPVALLSTADFDPSSVDPDSIRFGRNGFEAEVSRTGEDNHPMMYKWDFNRDGLRDVVYYFRMGDTGFSCEDIPARQHMTKVDATLIGSTPDYWVRGSDFLTLFRLFVFSFGF